MSVLQAIVEHKQAELAARRARRSLQDVRSAAVASPAPRDFSGALKRPGLSVIAEIKRRSPAKGDLRTDIEPASLARRYESGGAAALSVLTDERFFGGSDDDLWAARAAVSLPVLRKDFTVDQYQVYEARALGADAVLVIVRALTDSLIGELLALAGELGLAALVEVHDAMELERAITAGARLIGVNNRDLDTLAVDPETSFRLKRLIPKKVICVAESGISTAEMAVRLARVGYDAILVGEALVRARDPDALLEELTLGARASHPSPAPVGGGFPDVRPA